MRLVEATVISITEASEKHQKLLVEYCQINKQIIQVSALNYLDLGLACTIGDKVLINTTGIDLDLGTGGLAFVMPTKALCQTDVQDGHIIKLRYTPLQKEFCTVEEQNSPYHESLQNASSIMEMPVVCCELHSQVPLVAAAIKYWRPQAKITYCMTDQAALPLALSDIIRACKSSNLIDATISCGQAFGGDFEAINTYSALLAAKYVTKADVTIVAIGPGTPGSATRFGHGGVAQGQALNAVTALGGQPIAALRISFADSRPRHYGLSHHSITMLQQICLSSVTAAIPKDLDSEQLDIIYDAIQNANLYDRHTFVHQDSLIGKIDLRGVQVTTMGRNQQQDPAFFCSAFAAGSFAAKSLVA